MSCQLPADCLNEIFEYLEEDKNTLHSCLLVNQLWCKISVRILWRNIWRFKHSFDNSYQSKVEKAIFNTLISCLPNESKEMLNELNVGTGTFQEAITSKPPLFNYAGFCRVLSIYDIGPMIDCSFGNVEQNVDQIEQITTQTTNANSLNLKDRKSLVVKEIIKMFIKQISSLKKLIYYRHTSSNISFIDFPGAREHLAELSELCCSSNIENEFFHQMSQTCHNLQTLSVSIYFEDDISNGLKELICMQNNLKNLNLFAYCGGEWRNIIPALTKNPNTLRKLHIYTSSDNCLPLSFISIFLNLQEIKFSFNKVNLEDFKKLQHVTFPKLKILKIPYQCPKPKYMIKFLENNGKYLKELHINNNEYYYNDSLGLSIAKFCPDLEKLSVELNNEELDVLKIIFNNCQYLESIKIWCGKKYLNEKELLESVVKYSPENFNELKICYDSLSPKLHTENLESFCKSWKNRASKKPISIIIMNDKICLNEKDIEIIEKYEDLGVIENFEIKWFYEEEEEEKYDHFY